MDKGIWMPTKEKALFVPYEDFEKAKFHGYFLIEATELWSRYKGRLSDTLSDKFINLCKDVQSEMKAKGAK